MSDGAAAALCKYFIEICLPDQPFESFESMRIQGVAPVGGLAIKIGN